jgi:alkane 1-monooxygenase
MALFQFTVYPTEHIYLHHRYVGSVKDPITSPKNQTIYYYAVQAFFSAHKFVFNYSKKIFFLCMLTNWIYLGGMFYHAYNQHQNLEVALLKVGFFVIVALQGFLFLEIVEYIEHYGLIYRGDG